MSNLNLNNLFLLENGLDDYQEMKSAIEEAYHYENGIKEIKCSSLYN